ncbi:methyltransferase family protein [Oceanithermus sp.]
MVSNTARALIWVVFLVGGAVAGVCLDLRWWPAWWRNPAWHILSATLGLVVLLAVFRVSKVTGRWLARCGRVGDIPRLQTNRLVVAGPYACMRHPMHLGLMFFPLAVALLLGSPAFVFVIAPLEALVILIMVLTIEEREARGKFGSSYAAYASRVPPFNLSPDCLRKLFELPPENPDCTNPYVRAA